MIGRFGRIAQAVGRAGTGLMLLALLVGMPQASLARPYTDLTGPTMEGDPTADDQPSPAPKGSKSAKFVVPDRQQAADPIRLKARNLNARLAMEIYFRLFLHIR